MAGNTADIAIIGGRKYWAGGPYSGQPVDSTPANAGDLTPYLTPSYTRQFTAPSQAATAPAQPASGPAWAQTASAAPAAPSALPTPPWQDIAAGRASGGGFNPGGRFGPGGETLPSLQRWGRLAPSERAGMQGYWSDQLGVDSNDVMSQMQKLRPQGFGSAPRWSGY